MAPHCATGCALGVVAPQKVLGMSPVPPCFPVSPPCGQFWGGAASSWKGVSGSCFACEATSCRANAPYPREPVLCSPTALGPGRVAKAGVMGVPVAARQVNSSSGTCWFCFPLGLMLRCLCPSEAETRRSSACCSGV